MWKTYMIDLNVKYGYNDRVSKHTHSTLPMLIDTFTAHNLRHTFRTILYLEGIDAQTSMEIMGHSDIRTTIDIYTDIKRMGKMSISDDYRHHLDTDFKVEI